MVACVCANVRANMRNRYLLGAILLLFFALTLSSCGGGSRGAAPPPAAPGADFALFVEASSVTTQQGGALQLQAVQATPRNGFIGTISLALSATPTGVTITPPAPLSITVPGISQATFQLAASQTAPVGNTTVTVSGTSGTLTHTATFSLVVTQAAPFALQVSPASLTLTPASMAKVQISLTANPGTSPQLGVNVSGPPNNSYVDTGAAQGFLTPTNPLSFGIIATDLAQPLQNYPVTIVASDNSGNTSWSPCH